MKKIIKSILECLLGSLIVLFFGPLLSPMSNPWYQVYSETSYWIFGILGCIILTFIIVYFTEINPRKFYHFLDDAPIAIFLLFSTFGLITSLIFIASILSSFIISAFAAFLILRSMIFYLI